MEAASTERFIFARYRAGATKYPGRVGGSADPSGGSACHVGTVVDLKDALHAVRHGWWVLLGCVLLGLGGAVALSWSVPPVYESSIRLFVASTDRTDVDASWQGDLYAQQRSESYARALRGEELAARVVETLELPLSPSEVAGKVTAIVSPDTVVVEATVADGSAERARAIAAALEQEFTGWVAQAEAPQGSESPRVEVMTIHSAELPSEPVSPDGELLLGLGGSLGFLLGLGLTVWGRRPWNTVATELDVRDLAGAPVIGVLPDRAPAEDATRADVVRGIRRNLELLGERGTPRVVVVTGAVPGDGSSTLARAVAEDLAGAGGRVVLVEADRRRARVPDTAALADVRGFFDVLAGAASLSEAVRREPGGRLSVVPPGRAPADPVELLTSTRLNGLLHALRASRDVVIIDAPPVLSLPDAALLGALADGCLLAVRHRRTRRGQFADATSNLTAAGGKVLAVVLTGVQRPDGAAAGASYRYRADADRGDSAAERRAVVTPHV